MKTSHVYRSILSSNDLNQCLRGRGIAESGIKHDSPVNKKYGNKSRPASWFQSSTANHKIDL